MLRLRTFGGLSLESDHGPLGGAGAQRRRLGLLAVLAEAGERGLTRDKLIGLLWPEVDETRARSALSQALYALKRDTGENHLVLGYDRLALNALAITSDVAEFDAAIARGEPAHAAALYAGAFLDGLHLDAAPEFEHWLDAARLRLGRVAERALEQLATDADARGDTAASVDWWRRLSVLDPLKPNVVRRLMEALVRSGDRAGALREAERHDERMRDEVGDSASADVMDYAESLREHPMPRRGTAPDAPPSRIPLVGDAMIGRDTDLDAVCALLDRPDVAMLTLTGAGGVGKTRLAIQAAREREAQFDRVYFADLSPVHDADGVAPAIAAEVGLALQGDERPLDALVAACAARRTLLILDNFEQVIAATPVVARLAAMAPTLKILVTSRTRMGIPAEHEVCVAPLIVPSEGDDPTTLRGNAAVRLFIRRATDASPSLAFEDDDVQAAAHICARLDGLPLAIELAAARCRLMGPRAVAARLDSGLGLLSGGSRRLPARHQTMRRAVAWSHALLTADEQRLFVRMATFAGGCTLAAAEAVCTDPASPLEVLDGITALVDASVIVRDPPAHDGHPRLRMLATVREFALELRDASPDADGVGRRHAEWYLKLAQSLAPLLVGEEQHEALAALAVEHANLGAALQYLTERGDAPGALQLGAALWRYWLVRGHLAEGRLWLARILTLPSAEEPALDALRADAMTGAGHLTQNTGAVDEAVRHFSAALEIRQRLGDHAGVATALADLGWIRWRQCDFAEARRLSSECLALAEALGATRIAALALTNLGAVALFEGNFAEACALFSRSAVLRDQVSDRRGVAFASTLLAWAMCRAGQAEEPLALLARAEETLHALNDQRLVYLTRDVRAEVFLRLGDGARAMAALEMEEIARGRRFGDRWSVAHGLALASWAARLLGRTEQAAAFADQSLALRRAEGDRYGEAESLALLSAAARARGDDAEAARLLRSSRDIREAIGDAAGVADCDMAFAMAEVAT